MTSTQCVEKAASSWYRNRRLVRLLGNLRLEDGTRLPGKHTVHNRWAETADWLWRPSQCPAPCSLELKTVLPLTTMAKIRIHRTRYNSTQEDCVKGRKGASLKAACILLWTMEETNRFKYHIKTQYVYRKNKNKTKHVGPNKTSVT